MRIARRAGRWIGLRLGARRRRRCRTWRRRGRWAGSRARRGRWRGRWRRRARRSRRVRKQARAAVHAVADRGAERVRGECEARTGERQDQAIFRCGRGTPIFRKPSDHPASPRSPQPGRIANLLGLAQGGNGRNTATLYRSGIVLAAIPGAFRLRSSSSCLSSSSTRPLVRQFLCCCGRQHSDSPGWRASARLVAACGDASNQGESQ